MRHDSDPDRSVKAARAAENIRRRFSAARRLWRVETIYITFLAAFAVLATFARLDAYFLWDLRISRALQTVTLPGFFTGMRLVSIFGDNWKPFILTILTAIAFLLFRRRSEAAGLVLSAGGAALTNSLLKLLIARPRPSSDLVTVFHTYSTQSFPSGHVTFYVSYFGFLFFVAYALLPRDSIIRPLAFLITLSPVLLIGLSRVYLGEHWPSDTLGAYLMSGVWLAFSLEMYRRWKTPAVTSAPDDLRSEEVVQ